MTRFQGFHNREFFPQKFPDVATLQSLHVYDGVRTLFAKIGWEKLLNLHAPSSALLTREFLATMSGFTKSGYFIFRVMNTTHELHIDDLCNMVHAPIDGTYGPNMSPHKFNQPFEPTSFWRAITRLNDYNPSLSKQSQIIHLVLKMTLRLICIILFPQEDKSKAGKKELELLWCMVSRNRKPHLGALLMWKLLKTTRSTIGQIHCCGLVSLLASVVHQQVPVGFPFFRGETRLTLGNLKSTNVFRSSAQGYVWMRERSRYLIVSEPVMLTLSDPPETTVWVLPSNIAQVVVEYEIQPWCRRRAQMIKSPTSPNPDVPSSSHQPFPDRDQDFHQPQQAELHEHSEQPDPNPQQAELHEHCEQTNLNPQQVELHEHCEQLDPNPQQAELHEHCEQTDPNPQPNPQQTELHEYCKRVDPSPQQAELHEHCEQTDPNPH
ncbi:unnamed protein product [Lactuca saligna]|uniref:Arabidopsis retrotransposon Orf1 C-terminal domain-containing protein n=1 Tax=Lactuca saligna TaxID=75948 RepID=A0AA35YMB3_LACSI|nr:unnamed protein product [Lactuca saligna]